MSPQINVTGNGKILVLIPCHNEQGRIEKVISQVKNIMPSTDIVVVDDCSSDNSVAEAFQAGAKVLSLCTNLGYGAALETGYLFAIKNNYETVLQMDGDGQHQADQLPCLLEPLAGGLADIVIGSRYMSNTGTTATTLTRRFGHRIFSGIIFLLSGMKISDPTSGFQGLNKNALALFASGIFPCDFPDSDVILMAKLCGLRITEIPARMQERISGESMHSGLKPIYYGLKMLLSILIVLLNFNVWKTWRQKHL
ncbi:MAG: glycosyltransferase family 2 protein [Kiritimatiellae bacterium]|nr:glycosyltransferase family 2 protein [Kiritimatiellia bacterium]MDD5522835.1 glycosyltransferase family 2 protein [Kiritimatiellia bacterium]